MVNMAPENFKRTEKVVVYILFGLSVLISGASWYFSDYRNSELDQARVQIEQGLLEIQTEAQRQTTTLTEIETTIAEQVQTRNMIDQRITLLELMQKARPTIEVFVSSADSSASHSSIRYCFRNRSSFPSNVTTEFVEFQGIGSLGEKLGKIEPYFLIENSDVGALMPLTATETLSTFRLKSFDRSKGKYVMSALFKFETPDYIREEIRKLASDLGIELDEEAFTFTHRQHFSFFGGHFDTQNYRSCE